MNTTPLYHLVIRDVHDLSTPLASFSSDMPPLSIHIGDTILPSTWHGMPINTPVHVVHIEHFIFTDQTDRVHHQVQIHVADNTEER